VFFAVSTAEDVYHEVLQDETDEDIFTIIAEAKSVHIIGSLLNAM